MHTVPWLPKGKATFLTLSPNTTSFPEPRFDTSQVCILENAEKLIVDIVRALSSYTRPEITLLLHARGDRALPGEAAGGDPVLRCVPWHGGTPLPGSGALGRPAPPELRARPARRGSRCPQSPAGLRRDGADTGSARPPRAGPVALRHRRGAGVSRGEAAGTRRRRRDTSELPAPLPAPQPGHGDSVPHCGTSALPQHGGAPRGAAGSPQPSRSPRAALASPRSPAAAAAAALGDAPQPELSPHLHRPHRPPGG